MLMRALVIAGLLWLTSGVASAEGLPKPLPAQSLEDALDRFSRTTGLQIIYRTRIASGLASKGARAGLSNADTLQEILKGTGLSFEFINARTVAILRPGETPRAGAASAETAIRVADSGAGGAEEGGVEQMIVEGERDKPVPFSTPNLDLTRTEDDVLPFIAFTARDIELSGAVNLQEFFQNRLPQNFSPDVLGEMNSGGDAMGGSANRVDMRGWGATETVFLLNGRRMGLEYPGNTWDYENATPNLQAIPLASIERIEILPSAGSVIYGGNATGGIINIITRKDFSGGQLALSYESPADVHRPRRTVSLNYGLPLRGQTGLRLFASLGESEPLKAVDRADVSMGRWRALAMARQPARLISQVGGNRFFTTSLFSGATPNIRGVTNTANLFSGISGAQASNFTTIPAGYQGGGDLGVFQPGVYNLQLDDETATLGAATSSIAAGFGVDKRFGDRWRWSVDYRYAQNDSEGFLNARLNFTNPRLNSRNQRVLAGAANNPFGQDVQVYLVDPRLRRPELTNRSTVRTYELDSTLHAAFGQWNGFLDASYSINRNRYFSNLFHEPDGGWANAVFSGRYNPFVDARTVAPAAPDFYAHYIAARSYTGSGTRNYQSALKASGPVLSLPAGVAQLTAGASWSRVDRDESYMISLYRDGVTGEPRIPLEATSDVPAPPRRPADQLFVMDAYALYAETNIPLLGAAQGLPMVDRLELFGSGRYDLTRRDGFRLGGSASDPAIPVTYDNDSRVYAFGLRYDMLKGMTLRASRSLGFKPPGMEMISPYDLLPEDVVSLVDLRRMLPDGETIELDYTQFITGGNPDLKAETTESTNFGLILTPHPGLRISIDYLESVRNDAIYFIGFDELLIFEARFPDRVLRGPPDGDSSGVGPIVFMRNGYINLNQMASRSLDLSFEHEIPDVLGGRLVVAGAATRNLSFKVQFLPGEPAEEQVRNVSSPFAQQIAWNGNAQLRWEGRQWGFGWNARYYDYVLAATGDRLLQGGDRAPAQLIHDFNVSYRAPSMGAGGVAGLLSGTSVTFGAKNVFDREPRFWAATALFGVSPYDSVQGRTLWLQMRKAFGK